MMKQSQLYIVLDVEIAAAGCAILAMPGLRDSVWIPRPNRRMTAYLSELHGDAGSE